MPDLSSWLTKQQAADAIGVATKTVERLARDGKLQQAERKQRDTGARVAVYHPEDVERLRVARNPDAAAFLVPEGPASSSNGHGTTSTAIARAVPPLDELLRALLGAIITAAEAERLLAPGAASESSQTSALWLTLDQAAAYSGLPRAHLRRLIAEGKLEAVKGRGFLVRRRDLEGL